MNLPGTSIPLRTESRRRPVRRGTIYFLVLAIAVLITTIGLAAAAFSRNEADALAVQSDSIKADLLARSAVEHALSVIDATPGWRSVYKSGVAIPPVPLGLNQQMRWELIDEKDGSLADDSSDRVRIVGIGRVSSARRHYGATLRFAPGLEALKTSLHAGGAISVAVDATLTTSAAPVSTNATLFVHAGASILGDAECLSVSGEGSVTGALAEGLSPRQLPDPRVLEFYLDDATVLPWSGDLVGDVLAPGFNSYGGSIDSEGLYYLDTGGSDVTIRGSRVYGTLFVRTGGGTVTIDAATLLHPHRSYRPALIVDGDLVLSLDSAGQSLEESAWSTNFNPPGAAYLGSSDSDESDSYPNEIQGLVHVTGSLVISDTSLVRGSIICEGDVTCAGTCEIVHDSSLHASPPLGYIGPLLHGWQREMR